MGSATFAIPSRSDLEVEARRRAGEETLDHDQVGCAVAAHAEVIDLDDSLVADGGGGLGLSFEAGDRCRVTREVGVEYLNRRSFTANSDMNRLVDRAHAALADLSNETVVVYDIPIAGHDRHPSIG